MDCWEGPSDGRRWNDLAEQVLSGRPLAREQGLEVLEADDLEVPALLAASFRVRHRHFGRRVQLYYLKNTKSGLCPEDCGYCSQSRVSNADIPRYRLQDEAAIVESARRAAANQAQTFCIVNSGRGPSDSELAHVLGAVRTIKATLPLNVCCCLGLLRPEQARLLKEAGVDRVNHNLNTSRRFYPEICTTHTFDDRLATLEAVRQAGISLCSGGIIGMGETHADVIDLAFTLRELGVESIPVNFLHPIDGTPLAGVGHLTPRDCLRALVLFRLVNPSREIRVAGGRELHLRSLQAMALYPANSLFVSDYLTTQGQTAEEDFRMLSDLGFEPTVAGYTDDALAGQAALHAQA